MWQKIKIFIIIFLIALFQVSLFPNLFFGRISPDAVLILIIIWSTKEDFEKIWFWPILSGFILDIVTLGRVGFNMLTFFVISFGINFFTRRFFVARKTMAFFVISLFIIGGTLINYTIIDFLNYIFNYFSNQGINFLQLIQENNLILKIINNLIIFILIYWPITKFLSNVKNKKKLIVK